MNQLEREKLQTLDGSRAATKDAKLRQAVRIVDVAPLLELTDRLQSAKAAGSTPTKAEFDALQADVEKMHLRLKAISENLSKILR